MKEIIQNVPVDVMCGIAICCEMHLHRKARHCLCPGTCRTWAATTFQNNLLYGFWSANKTKTALAKTKRVQGTIVRKRSSYIFLLQNNSISHQSPEKATPSILKTPDSVYFHVSIFKFFFCQIWCSQMTDVRQITFLCSPAPRNSVTGTGTSS